jgi:hypothetical protein
MRSESMGVKVTTGKVQGNGELGTETHKDARYFEVVGQVLYINKDTSTTLAVYAPDAWKSAVMTE